METINSTEEQNDTNSKSHVKIFKNSRGINWEVKVVHGEEDQLEKLKDAALKLHDELKKELQDVPF